MWAGDATDDLPGGQSTTARRGREAPDGADTWRDHLHDFANTAYMQDETSGTFPVPPLDKDKLILSTGAVPAPGVVVGVRGFTEPGGYMPAISVVEMRYIQRQKLPGAPDGYAHGKSGAYAGGNPWQRPAHLFLRGGGRS